MVRGFRSSVRDLIFRIQVHDLGFRVQAPHLGVNFHKGVG